MRIPPALLVLLVATLAAAQAPARPTVHHVDVAMTADSYSPAEAVAAVGDTVIWKNADLVAHTATSKGPGWDSGKIKPGKDFRWVATKPGTWQYLCTTHRRMRGTLTVK
jgi:plastocyanin